MEKHRKNIHHKELAVMELGKCSKLTLGGPRGRFFESTRPVITSRINPITGRPK
jgi:hypothetical protein